MIQTNNNVPKNWRNPNWEKKEKCHCWRNYINEKIIEIWDTFNEQQKQAIALNSQDLADNENWD